MNELKLPYGLHLLPKGTLPAIATFVEMREPAAPRTVTPPAGVTVKRQENPTVEWYRDLVTRVGERWLWFQRRIMSDQQLAAIIHDPKVEIWVPEIDGVAQGIAELDFRVPNEVEIANFGLTPETIGGGVGRYLMDNAIAQAFREPIERLWLHTCNLDSPQALGFYRRSGFVPYRFALDLIPDPRLGHDYPMAKDHHVPIIA